MAVELFKLVGSIFIDTDKANESLQKTDKKASSFAETLGNTAKGAIAVGTAMVGMGVAVGTAALKVTDDIAAQADVIDKASIRMGIGVEKYQEYAYAANQCGVEVSTLEQAAKKLEGTDINFDEAIESIMSLGTAEERSAAAADLFGDKIAYTLSPLIEQSGEDFESLTQRAHDLGIVMSEDSVKAGVEFGDLFSDLKQSIGSLATALGSALMPIMIDVINQLLAFMPEIQGFMGQLAPVLAEVVQAVLPILFEILKALLPVAMEIIQTILPLAIDIINSLLPLVQALLPLIEPISSLLMAILVPLVDLLTELLPPLIDAITNITVAVIPALTWAIEFIEEVVADTLGNIMGDVKPWIAAVISVINGLATFLSGVFTGDWEKAWEGIKQITKGFVNVIITYISGTINAVIDLINMVITAAIKLANLIPGVDINKDTAQIPKVNIPLLAKGGVVEEEGSAIVGEKGAELLTLPKGAQVAPLNNNNVSTLTKEDITQAFVEALQTVGLQVTINPNTKNLFDEVVSQNTIYKRTHGGLSAL